MFAEEKLIPHRNCGILRRGIRNFAFEEDRGQRRDDLLLARAAAAAAVRRQAEDGSGRDGGEVRRGDVFRDAVAAQVLHRRGAVGRRREVGAAKRPEKLKMDIIGGEEYELIQFASSSCVRLGIRDSHCFNCAAGDSKS